MHFLNSFCRKKSTEEEKVRFIKENDLNETQVGLLLFFIFKNASNCYFTMFMLFNNAKNERKVIIFYNCEKN